MKLCLTFTPTFIGLPNADWQYFDDKKYYISDNNFPKLLKLSGCYDMEEVYYLRSALKHYRRLTSPQSHRIISHSSLANSRNKISIVFEPPLPLCESFASSQQQVLQV